MPSAFTHLVVGSATAQVLPAELPRRRLALALGLAAAVPDLDVLAFRLGIPYGHPLGHRGFSHSLLAAALLGGVVALMATRNRLLARRHAWSLLGVGFLAVASHGLLDAATDAGRGIGFFIPFSNERLFWPWRPIATASVNPARFFSARGMAVLWSEIRWVWFPLAALSIVGWLARWLAARHQPAEETGSSLGAGSEWSGGNDPDDAEYELD